MTDISILTVGFSIIVAIILVVTYLFFIEHTNKNWVSTVSSVGVLGGLSIVQYHHYLFYVSGIDPLSTVNYRFIILFIPPLFYFFSRTILFPDRKTTPVHILHLVPISLVFFVPPEITIPLAFFIGVGYCFWLTSIIYKLIAIRKGFKLVFYFFALFSILSLSVLIFGLITTNINPAYFYHFYTIAIGISLALVTATLIVKPDILDEIDEVVRLGYSNSTLNNLNVDGCIKKLSELMDSSKMYQNENLSLAILSDEMEISNHQLSELINTQFKLGFSQYIRLQRIEAAKQLLKTELSASILSISMQIGFKSQSNFYAAFKEITGESPGSYRKATSS
jgi:AraC-like DNA-binding protein